MLASALTAVAMTAAVVGMLMVVIVGMAVIMQVIMVVGMCMIVGVCVIMGMGVSNTVVGMLVGVGMIMFMVVAAAGDVIVMDVHMVSPLRFFFYYTYGNGFCQNIYFCGNIPPSGLRNLRKVCIMKHKL